MIEKTLWGREASVRSCGIGLDGEGGKGVVVTGVGMCVG